MIRRDFLKKSMKTGMFAATAPLWRSNGLQAFAQVANPKYKAVVVVELEGGNDANNMVIPLDAAEYAEYAAIRGCLALPAASCLPLNHSNGDASYGLHPSLVGLANLYNQKRALFVANVGPIRQLVNKQQLIANPNYAPSLFSHPTGVAQWESALTTDTAVTGWGGRMGDIIAAQSGSLPPLLNMGIQNLFTVGETVQAVAVQAGGAAVLSPALDNVIMQMAQADTASANALIAQTARLKVAAMQQQTLIDQASSYAQLRTAFPSSGCGASLQRVAQMIAGRSVVGASRQIFFVPQGSYDSHQNQLQQQSGNFWDLDQGLTAFMAALDELGITDQVLVCTLSDFNRTFAPNVNAGSDHGWGTHQFVLGGGVQGGRVMGKMPVLELNGPDDVGGLGQWLPTTAVTQFTAGVGAWMGLNASQVSSVFPELVNFSSGALRFGV